MPMPSPSIVIGGINTAAAIISIMIIGGTFFRAIISWSKKVCEQSQQKCHLDQIKCLSNFSHERVQSAIAVPARGGVGTVESNASAQMRYGRLFCHAGLPGLGLVFAH
jgi:hypothetical protein